MLRASRRLRFDWRRVMQDAPAAPRPGTTAPEPRPPTERERVAMPMDDASRDAYAFQGAPQPTRARQAHEEAMAAAKADQQQFVTKYSDYFKTGFGSVFDTVVEWSITMHVKDYTSREKLDVRTYHFDWAALNTLVVRVDAPHVEQAELNKLCDFVMGSCPICRFREKQLATIRAEAKRARDACAPGETPAGPEGWSDPEAHAPLRFERMRDRYDPK